MMKNILGAILILVFLVGCGIICLDCEPQKGNSRFYYVNNSSISIVLVGRVHSSDELNLPYHSNPIAPGDTGRYWRNLGQNDNSFFPFELGESTLSNIPVSILFKSSPVKCFNYSNQATDEENDIRLKSAYEEVETVDYEGDQLFLYYYTINENHYNNAGECPEKVLEE